MSEPGERFLRALDSAADPSAVEALEPAIAGARAQHPTVAVTDADFAHHLGERLDPEDVDDLEAVLARRRLDDLYLALGCVRRDPGALAHFEAALVPDLRRAVERVAGPSDLADDVVGTLRERLLVGTDARGPRLADYAGRGELRTWLRVVAVREARTQIRRHQRQLPDDDALYAAAAPDVDPEIAAIKSESAALVKSAFHAALAELEPRQRNLLRQQLLDDLGVDELGRLYGVHRATAARWLSRARADLWRHTERRLRRDLGLGKREVESLLDAVRSTLDLSVERVLGEP